MSAPGRTMRALLFPGQGSQEVGMGSDLARSDAPFQSLLRQASDLAGVDLRRICLRGPERDLTRTRNLQPLLVCVSLGYLSRLRQAGAPFDFVLGHSLGEITALAAAEIVDFPTAVKIAVRRGAAMDNAAAQTDGAMLALIADDRNKVLQGIREHGPAAGLTLANDNSPDQFVLSGESRAVEEAARFIADRSLGRSRRLNVAGPWHSPLMRGARGEFERWLADIPFAAPSVPLLLNGSAEPETDPETIRRAIGAALTSPVRWRESMNRLRESGVRTLIEVGPGRTLSGLARANGFGNETAIFQANNLRGVRAASEATAPTETLHP